MSNKIDKVIYKTFTVVLYCTLISALIVDIFNKYVLSICKVQQTCGYVFL